MQYASNQSSDPAYVQQSFFEEGTRNEYDIVDLKFERQRRMKMAKSNLLVEAHYELSPLENKLMLLAMSNIRRDQKNLTQQVFKITEICDCLGISQQNASRDLNRISRNLMKKQLEIRVPESNDWELHQWVSKTWVKRGDFGIKFDESLTPYLLGLVNRFTQYQLENVLKMRSSYSIRLYELLKQVEQLGSRTFSLDPKVTKGETWGDFAKLMGYNPGSYKRYSNIRQRIISPAIQQIEELTEFTNIAIIPKKHQNRTIAITVTFNTQPMLEQFQESNLYRQMKGLLITDASIKDMISRFETHRIERNIDYVMSVYHWKPHNELAPLTVAAINHDYANSEVGGRPAKKLESPKTKSDTDPEPTDVPEHPLFSKCENMLEFNRLRAAEEENGESFSSYNEFTKFLLDSKFK